MQPENEEGLKSYSNVGIYAVACERCCEPAARRRLYRPTAVALVSRSEDLRKDSTGKI